MNEIEPVQSPDTTNSSPKVPPETHPLFQKTVTFPHLPGVYIFKDSEGTVLYVGKARDLKKRAGSYFRSTAAETMKTRVLLGRATAMEYVVTSTEKEALLLEASLIKKHRPRYNVILRDDKNYPALRIDPREPYPRIEVVRRFQRDGAVYFGPYPSSYAVRETLKLLNQMFPLRLCKSKKLVTRERPCLNHSLGRCLGVCAGKVTQEEYRKMADEVILFLQGKTEALQQQLSQQMAEAAQSLEFERAALYRDRIHAVTATLEKQHIVSGGFLNQDILGLHQDIHGTLMVVLFIRQGVLIGQKDFDLKDAQGEKDELTRAFIQQYYGEGRYIPDEIIVPVALEDEQVLEEWFSEMKGRRVRVWPVKRGDRKHLLDLAESNARERSRSRHKGENRDIRLLEALQRTLKLPRVPLRMACVDISNIQGQHAVGGIVIFQDGQPDKGSYRHFRIQGTQEPDDPAMMAEVVHRFFHEEEILTSSLDLLVLDGGKGQLNRINALMKEEGMVERLPVISIAKERENDRGEKGRGMYEKIYIPGRKNPLFLSRFPDLLHLLQRLRDEAHRFAISRYQSRHRRDLLSSVLDGISGVGAKRRQLLLQHFHSMEALQQASIEELMKVPGIPGSLAESIHKSLTAEPE